MLMFCIGLLSISSLGLCSRVWVSSMCCSLLLEMFCSGCFSMCVVLILCNVVSVCLCLILGIRWRKCSMLSGRVVLMWSFCGM